MHFCPSQSFSGLEQYALELAAFQKSHGHEVVFVVFPGSYLKKLCVQNKIPTWDFDSTKSLEVVVFNRAHPGFFSQFDVIHLHSTQEVSRFFYLRMLQTVKKRPKIILQMHLWINHYKKNPYHRLIYSVVDELWCSSEPAKKSLEHYLPIEPKKIKIINYGRDIKKQEAQIFDKKTAREKLGLSQTATIIGTVSRIEKSKGVKELMHAFADIFHNDKNLHLVVIGGSSPNNAAAEKYFLNLRKNKPPQTYFMGVMLESFKYLKAFDLYILPSYEECFSLALLDAQLAALPVVGTNSGGTPELVRPGETGWLCEPKSLESLKEAIKSALREKDKWPAMGEKAKERVKKEYDQQEIFNNILKEYAN